MTRVLMFTIAIGLAPTVALSTPDPAGASPQVRYGIQDDAWLAYGPGTVNERVDTLDRMGIKLVRFTLEWHEIAPARPGDARDPSDPAYRWGSADGVLRSLAAHGMVPIVTLWGAPAWSNGGRGANWIPASKWSLAAFAYAAQKRYPFVRHWLIWNEPNQRRWLRPTSPREYTRTLLNPAYAALKAANQRALVGGGVTAPRGGSGGVSPVRWIRGMRAAHAKLDAYAHNPYPLRRRETPWSGGCRHCETITMATLGRLIHYVRINFSPSTRIWLTEYGYQTNPPDRILGVSRAAQASYVGAAARRAFNAPRVDMLIHYLYRDEPRQAVGRAAS